MLPLDSRYGWWPYSGEIDIMEYPTNELTKIYGTVHTENYNLFEGRLPPQGGTVDIPDATSAFHLYAIEWTPEKIDFFVDGQKYYTFNNNDGSSATWPFDQPFYLILNLAVGGGWVGAPDESTIFPAVMEVDYVRVYQEIENLGISGNDFVIYNSENHAYRVGEIEGATYQWTVPGGAEITTGQGTSKITVDWGLFGGDVEVLITTDQGFHLKKLPVRVSSNLLKNSSFEKGVKYWNSRLGFPVVAEITLNGNDAWAGSQSVFSIVEQPPANPWDVQLSQGDIALKAGTRYYGSFMAKSGLTANQITAAVINASNFALAAQKAVTPGENWESYEFEFTPSQSFTALFNVDIGANTGSYYLDNFILTTQELKEMNLVKNPDFFDEKKDWTLTTLSGAIAEGTVENGEYVVSTDNAGNNAWDVHLGQSGIALEQGYEYTLSFDAYTDANRQITPIVGKNGEPWTLYNTGEPVSLSSNLQTYSFTFPMNEPTDLQSRLGFDIGGSDASVFFDNILLRKGKEINTTSINKLHDIEIQVFPNPAKEKLYIRGENLISITIYNLNGKTVYQSFPEGNSHEMDLTKLRKGIYLLKVRTDYGDYSERIGIL
jgi:beta-glucanase (GH16 family)